MWTPAFAHTTAAIKSFSAAYWAKPLCIVFYLTWLDSLFTLCAACNVEGSE